MLLFLLPKGPTSTNDIRISGVRPRRAQGISLDSVSHPSFILLGAFPSLVYDSWLDAYFHLGDLRAPHTFHDRKRSDLVLADLALLPFLPVHSGLEPRLSLALPPVSLRSASLTSWRALTLSPPSQVLRCPYLSPGLRLAPASLMSPPLHAGRDRRDFLPQTSAGFVLSLLRIL